MTHQGVLIEDDAMGAALKEHKRAKAPAVVPSAHQDINDWMDCERERRHLETELKRVVSTQERCRQQVLERWAGEGISREGVQGYTVHLQRKVYPKVRDPHGLALALQEEGFDDLLTVDEKLLAVWATAREEEGKPLPDSIAAYLGDSYERFAIAVRITGRAH